MVAVMSNELPTRVTPAAEDLCPTRQSLLARLKNWDDHESWREFFDTYWRLIYNVALKSGLNEAEAEDVVQETVLSVAKKMKAFQYDPALGSFKGWLLQLTGWRIANQFKKRGWHRAGPARGDDGSGMNPWDQIPDPNGQRDLEQVWEEEWQENLLQTAVNRVRRQVNPQHFQIFDLCVAQQRSAAEVARFLGVSIGQVYLARHRVGRQIKKQVRYLQEKLS